MFSERHSAQVLCDSNLVPDKTFKRYKAAKFHRIVPFKTVSRDGISDTLSAKVSWQLVILQPLHSAQIRQMLDCEAFKQLIMNRNKLTAVTVACILTLTLSILATAAGVRSHVTFLIKKFSKNIKK